jgi:hypothetical protein
VVTFMRVDATGGRHHDARYGGGHATGGRLTAPGVSRLTRWSVARHVGGGGRVAGVVVATPAGTDSLVTLRG